MVETNGEKEVLGNDPRVRTCRDCLYWPKFKESCWYFWGYKKHCTMKVTDPLQEAELKRQLENKGTNDSEKKKE